MSIIERPVLPDELELIPTLPAEPVTRRDVLLRAAELLEMYGWRTGELGNCGSGFCVLGAIGYAAGIYAGTWDEDEEANVYALAAAFTGAPPADLDDLDPDEVVFGWNDSHSDGSLVIAVLRRLADGATWDEATA